MKYFAGFYQVIGLLAIVAIISYHPEPLGFSIAGAIVVSMFLVLTRDKSLNEAGYDEEKRNKVVSASSTPLKIAQSPVIWMAIVFVAVITLSVLF